MRWGFLLFYHFQLNSISSLLGFYQTISSMALSACLSQSHLQFKVNSTGLNYRSSRGIWTNTQPLTRRSGEEMGAKLKTGLSFTGGSKPLTKESFGFATTQSKDQTFSVICSSHLAASVFTCGTIAVLPFYTLMIAAPKADITKKVVGSSLPYMMLGLVYGLLLYRSWTPDTWGLMFSSKYWLPELGAIAKLFSSEMTLASAWVHLLAIDLFAARQVFQEGLREDIETRHSVSLCLLFCPLGVATHFITKAVYKASERNPYV